MKPFLQKLSGIVGNDVKVDEPLMLHTHFKTGGPAKYLAVAETAEEIVELVKAAVEHHVDWVILGGGTNVLANDKGFDGLIIKAANRAIEIDESTGRVVAQAGALSSAVARKTADAGLTGLEWAISLPGTIGGAVRGNAGCFGGETKDHLMDIEVFDAEEERVKRVSKRALQMSYRDSKIKRRPWVVLSAVFQLERADREVTNRRIEEVLKCRLASQPKNAKCAGCAFKNFEFENESELEKLKETVGDAIPPHFLEQKRIPAGWLIDRLDLKGTCIGGACVNQAHGNFVTSDGTATSDQIAELLALLKTRVRNAYGIQLHEEIQYIGFPRS